MKKKKAIITVELVTESTAEDNEKIARELLAWFREDAVYVPWVKDVKEIVVKEN
ncbi:MAG: hypothetical protein ACUVQW_05575 [Candidatus Bathycorpusculaceae bacterium]